MFRKNLSQELYTKKLISLSNNWFYKMNGLIKTPFFDENDKNHGYVLYYSEIKQSYFIVKFSITNGDVIFEQQVVNGGYGTGAIYKNQIICLKEFKDIISIDKNNGNFLWEFTTDSRIRSSINIIDEEIVFSSGENIYFIDQYGNLIRNINIENTFLYGTISKINNHYIAIGTKFNKDKNDSYLYLYAFDKNNNILFEKGIGKSVVISSDTSGFWVQDDEIIMPYNNKVLKINGNNGEIIWNTEVVGFVGRHTVVSDGKNIFYTTLKGKIGCLDLNTGNKKWEISTQENLIFSPPSVYGDTLLVLADCVIYLIDKNDGKVYFNKVVGHSPYSAPIIFNDMVFVGGGEPPLNGVLLSFKMIEKSSKTKAEEIIKEYFEIGNYVENDKMQLSITTKVKVNNIVVDTSVISKEKIIRPSKQLDKNYIFDIELKNNNLSGLYSIPVSFKYKGKDFIEIIKINLNLKENKPRKIKLNIFNEEIKELNVFYSGAALSEHILNKYNKKINQKEFRKIIDYVKDKSGWKDADFQTWRLILKRVLSSPAKTLEEFIELEREYEKKHKITK